MGNAYGNRIDPHQVVFAKTEAAITVAAGTALCVVATGDEYGEVKLPAADGAAIYGFIYESTTAAAEEARVARGELFWVPVAEAISIGDELMCESATGHVKVLTATKYKVGTALTAQSTEHGYCLVQAEIGPQKET